VCACIHASVVYICACKVCTVLVQNNRLACIRVFQALVHVVVHMHVLVDFYSSWLRRKKEKSRKEAELKKEFRKHYRSDSKRLKRSLALR